MRQLEKIGEIGRIVTVLSVNVTTLKIYLPQGKTSGTSPPSEDAEEDLNLFTNLKENSRAHLNTLQEKKNFFIEENPELNENLRQVT